MVSTALTIFFCTSLISPSISLADFWVRLASVRTSPATTLKPRPCSPARAASIAALSASRFVCSARSLTVVMISPIACACSASSRMLAPIESTCTLTWSIAAALSSTASRPCFPISAARCAETATARARSAACSAVWTTSSTVAAVCVTAAIDSVAPDACSVVVARISAALVASTLLVSCRGRATARLSSHADRIIASRATERDQDRHLRVATRLIRALRDVTDPRAQLPLQSLDDRFDLRARLRCRSTHLQRLLLIRHPHRRHRQVGLLDPVVEESLRFLPFL